MAATKPSWPGPNEKLVIEEMIKDPNSKHWAGCREYVRWCVQKQASYIPDDKKDDITQEVMIRIIKSLGRFQQKSKLTTWAFAIVSRCISDSYRQDNFKHFLLSLDDIDSNDFVHQIALTPEEEAVTRDELTNALKALENYINAHAKSDRNAKILNMVIFQGHSLEMAAREAGCSAAVAGYIVRSAQRYIRSQ